LPVLPEVRAGAVRSGGVRGLPAGVVQGAHVVHGGGAPEGGDLARRGEGLVLMLVCPLEIPPGLDLMGQERWLLREIDQETLRHDSLECRVQRLYEALAIVQRAIRRE